MKQQPGVDISGYLAIFPSGKLDVLVGVHQLVCLCAGKLPLNITALYADDVTAALHLVASTAVSVGSENARSFPASALQHASICIGSALVMLIVWSGGPADHERVERVRAGALQNGAGARGHPRSGQQRTRGECRCVCGSQRSRVGSAGVSNYNRARSGAACAI